MARKDLDDWIFHMGAEMHRLCSEMSPAPPQLARQKGWAPRVDVFEAPDHVLVKVELAGVRGGQFIVHYSAENHSLVFRGFRQDESVDPSVPTASHQLEIDYGEFAREVKLPDVPLSVGDSQAQLTNGILTIVIPKSNGHDGRKVVMEHTITVQRLK